jgi:hypothetical protein
VVKQAAPYELAHVHHLCQRLLPAPRALCSAWVAASRRPFFFVCLVGTAGITAAAAL